MSTLNQLIGQEIKKAMLSKDSLRLNTLLMLKSAIGYAAIDAKKDELDDASIIKVIQKEAKKRRDAEEQFIKGGRKEQAEQERQELEILETYLPKPLSPEELQAAVEKAIADTGASSKKEMGTVIRAVQATTEGRAEGKAISQLVGKLLS